MFWTQAELCGQMPRKSITLERVSGSPTPKDNARSATLLALRQALVADADVQAAFDWLSSLRPPPHSPGLPSPPPGLRLLYEGELQRVSAALDGHWDRTELDVLMSSWRDSSKRALIIAGLVTIAGAAGRPGIGRTRSAATVAQVARSLARRVPRVSGMSAAAADEAVTVDAMQTRQAVAVYRQRLRDTAAEQPPPPAAAKFVRWEDAPEWVRRSTPHPNDEA
jgi:hypothetical protein